MKPIKQVTRLNQHMAPGTTSMGVGRLKLKKTTLLVIGAVLLWSAVALWNGIQKENGGSGSIRITTGHLGGEHPSTSRLTATNFAARVPIGTHRDDYLTAAANMI